MVVFLPDSGNSAHFEPTNGSVNNALSNGNISNKTFSFRLFYRKIRKKYTADLIGTFREEARNLNQLVRLRRA